jgi:transcriptional regulator of acetoin/glycerol metabolism
MKSALPRKVASPDKARDRAELEAILDCLQLNNDKVFKAASDPGVSCVTLYRLFSIFSIID